MVEVGEAALGVGAEGRVKAGGFRRAFMAVVVLAGDGESKPRGSNGIGSMLRSRSSAASACSLGRRGAPGVVVVVVREWSDEGVAGRTTAVTKRRSRITGACVCAGGGCV